MCNIHHIRDHWYAGSHFPSNHSITLLQYVKYKIYYFQAVRCFLWGLVDLAGDPNVAGHIADTILGKTLVASVKSLPNQKNPAVGIVLYDTSTDDDINMNTVLIENVCKDVVAPHLPPVSSTLVLLYFLSDKGRT